MSTTDEQGPVEEAAEAVKETAGKIDPTKMAFLVNTLGGGFLAMTVSLVSATIATQKFRSYYEGRYPMGSRRTP